MATKMIDSEQNVSTCKMPNETRPAPFLTENIVLTSREELNTRMKDTMENLCGISAILLSCAGGRLDYLGNKTIKRI
jgi:hypothetical protein